MRRRLLTLTAAVTVICWLINAKRLFTLLFSEYLYKKDFVQFYLMGHALRAGENMYAPLAELAARFDPSVDKWLLISAYPPIVALIGLPLSYLPYFWSVIAWMVFELGCLVAAVILIVRHFGGRSAGTAVFVTVAAYLGCQPIYMDLYLGQVMIPILLLLTLTWLALKSEKDFLAGVLLGIVIAIKLYAWPIALFLLIKGRWRAPVAAVAVFIAANGLMTLLVGTSTILDYYFRVGGAVLAEYIHDPFNFSAWSVGFRYAGIAGGGVAVLTLLSFALALALRSKDFDTGFMVMLAASTILQPISWIHYVVTLLPAFCFIANRREFRVSDLTLSWVLILLIVPGFHHVAHSYPALASWPPLLFILGLMWLIVPKPTREASEISCLAAETT